MIALMSKNVGCKTLSMTSCAGCVGLLILKRFDEFIEYLTGGEVLAMFGFRV